MIKRSLMFLLIAGAASCAHTSVYVAPHACLRNYEYCVESYDGDKREFCQIQDNCSREHWNLLCQQDLRRCENGGWIQ